MKHIITSIVCLAVGIGVGWYFGYTRPTAKNQRELLAEYQYERDHFHLTDAEMAEAGPKIPQYFEDMKRQDEAAARYSLGAYKILEQGDVERAKSRLLLAVGSYYRVYHDKGGDTNLLDAIAIAAQKYPAVAAEIARKD